MNSETASPASGLPVYEPESEAIYSLEIMAELAGVHSQCVLRYQELGLVSPVQGSAGPELRFDGESLRQLRRIQHLCETCGVNDAGLKFILSLLGEVERLREERRSLSR